MTQDKPTTSLATPLRLADEYLLYPGKDGHWRLYGPEDAILRIQADPDLVARAQEVLSRSISPAAISAGTTDPALRDLLDQFVAQGVTRPQESALPSPPPTVLVLGTSILTDSVVRVLRDSSLNVELQDAANPAIAAAVVCADRLPDAYWLELDARFAQSGIPWHTCYHEAGKFFAGPLCIPGKSAGYADCRARRLAAASHPEELLDLWAYLDSDPALPVPEQPASVPSFIAGLLVADVVRVLQGKTAASAGFQLEIDPESLQITRHPVLPLPAGLMPAVTP